MPMVQRNVHWGGTIISRRRSLSRSTRDAFGVQLAAAEAVTARGTPLRDLQHVQQATVPAAGDGLYEPDGPVSRGALAYALVQALGREAQAGQVRAALGDDPVTVEFNGQRVDVEDTHLIPPFLRGHVQLALDLQLMAARFSMTQGPFDPFPTIRAHFEPRVDVTRASYAFSAVNYVDRFRQAQ
jgi:serine protease AprX